MHKTSRGISFGLLCSAMALTAQGLSTSEKKLAAYVDAHLDQQLTLLPAHGKARLSLPGRRMWDKVAVYAT